MSKHCDCMYTPATFWLISTANNKCTTHHTDIRYSTRARQSSDLLTEGEAWPLNHQDLVVLNKLQTAVWPHSYPLESAHRSIIHYAYSRRTITSYTSSFRYWLVVTRVSNSHVISFLWCVWLQYYNNCYTVACDYLPTHYYMALLLWSQDLTVLQ